MNHLVFADATNVDARELQADALEQLGYQSESATFRNAYLTGAHELRYGHPPRNDAMKRGYLTSMTIEQLLDAMAVRVQAEQLSGRAITAHLRFGGDAPWGGDWTLVLSNRALSSVAGLHEIPAVTLTLDRSVLVDLSSNSTTIDDAIESGRVTAEGDRTALTELFANLDTFQSMFPVVEP